MQVALTQHHRGNGIAHHGVIFPDGFGQIPIGGKRNALGNTRAPSPVFYFHEERFAEIDVAFSRLHGMREGLLHAIQGKRLDVDALVIALLQRTSVHLTGNGAREFIHHQNMLGMMKLRHAAIQVIVHHMGVFLRACCRTNTALSRIDAKLFLVAGDGFGGIVGLDERHGAIPPGFIGGAEHVGVLHTGNAQQNILNFSRVDVFAARNNEVFGARVHTQKAVTVDRGPVAGNEIAIGAHSLAGI